MSAERDDADAGQRELDVRVGFGLFASEGQLDHLVSIARQVDVDVGEVLYARGNPVTSLFQLTSGAIEMAAPDLPTWRFTNQAAAGLLDFVLGRPHTRTATTTVASRLLELDAADYRDYLEDNFEVSVRIISQLSTQIIAEIAAGTEAERFLGRTAEAAPRSFAEIEIPLVDRLLMLSRMTVFRGSSVQALANLAQRATEVRFAAGDVIVTAGSVASSLSLLVEGEVELELPNGQRVRRGGRDLVAYLEELAVAPRSMTVTATRPTIVLQIERDDLLDRIEEHFDLAMALFACVATAREQLNNAVAAAD
ncbi:MAG: cyclic nucleotide-binding domain-containing protein [Kofleriaceae bacterium]